MFNHDEEIYKQVEQEPITTEMEDRIIIGEESGLAFTGEFEDDLPQFIGTKQEFKKYEEALEEAGL